MVILSFAVQQVTLFVLTLLLLDFGVNEIGTIGATAFAQSLEINTNLLSLFLGCNKIGMDGAIALAHMIQNNTTLTNLDIQYNLITRQGVIALVDALETNFTMNAFYRIWYLSDELDEQLQARLKVNRNRNGVIQIKMKRYQEKAIQFFGQVSRIFTFSIQNELVKVFSLSKSIQVQRLARQSHQGKYCSPLFVE